MYFLFISSTLLPSLPNQPITTSLTAQKSTNSSRYQNWKSSVETSTESPASSAAWKGESALEYGPVVVENESQHGVIGLLHFAVLSSVFSLFLFTSI